jgi:hypothetical protein
MAKRFADPAKCIAMGLAVLVGVDLQGDGQPGMAEVQPDGQVREIWQS